MTKVGLLSVLLSLSFAVNLYLLFISPSSEGSTKNIQPETEKYGFLSKRIFAENQNDILINFVPLRAAAREYIANQKVSIGYYFEYLPSGTSIGVNDQMEIRIASLIKVPIVMAVYKEIEQGNLSKDGQLTLSKNDINKDFGNLWERGEGAKIEVDEAVDLALTKSDNTAARVLNSNLPEGAVDRVYDSLDIPKNFKDDHPIISPKNYTSILRSLYLSSYLTRDSSNEILDKLTKTEFTNMLPAGVNAGVKVAHKMGVYDAQETFSDCGIVYVPGRPYAICIMVKGSESEAVEHIRLLSKMAFEYVTKASR